jgi:hypothetical protein
MGWNVRIVRQYPEEGIPFLQLSEVHYYEDNDEWPRFYTPNLQAPSVCESEDKKPIKSLRAQLKQQTRALKKPILDAKTDFIKMEDYEKTTGKAAETPEDILRKIDGETDWFSISNGSAGTSREDLVSMLRSTRKLIDEWKNR